MHKFDNRILDVLGIEVSKDELADQCEINSISHKYGEPVNTTDLLKCDFKFVEFEKMPMNMGRCFCGKKIDICYVINHIETGKQFVLGKDCLFIIFGDRLKRKCTKCGLASTKENRVRSNGVCKKCVKMEFEEKERAKRQYKPISFEFNGSSRDRYIEDRERLTRALDNSLIKFGRYKYQLTPAEIRKTDPSYFRWLVNKVDSMKCLANL